MGIYDTLENSEKLAETLYNLYRSGRIKRHALVRNFISLLKYENNIGAHYLLWLMCQCKNKKIINDFVFNVKKFI